jgi:thiamine biosynthesis lipoprotein
VALLARRGDEERARADLAAARRACRELEARLSEWRADSEVSLANARAGRTAERLSPLLRRLLAGAAHVAEATGGTFDFTWASLGRLWDEAERRGAPPTGAELEPLLPALGWRNAALQGDELRFRHPSTRLGVASFAKGWIIDAVFLLLRGRGHQHLIVNIGGDLRAAGRGARGRPHLLHLLDPFQPSRAIAQLTVDDVAVATSGNYFRRRWIQGTAYGHILDPRTGFPPAFDGSVTVLARDAAMADALATALFVMGPAAGLAFARAVPGLEAVFATREGLRSTMPVR